MTADPLRDLVLAFARHRITRRDRGGSRWRPSAIALELARMEAAGHDMEPTNFFPDLPRGHARNCWCRAGTR